MPKKLPSAPVWCPVCDVTYKMDTSMKPLAALHPKLGGDVWECELGHAVSAADLILMHRLPPTERSDGGAQPQ